MTLDAFPDLDGTHDACEGPTSLTDCHERSASAASTSTGQRKVQHGLPLDQAEAALAGSSSRSCTNVAECSTPTSSAHDPLPVTSTIATSERLPKPLQLSEQPTAPAVESAQSKAGGASTPQATPPGAATPGSAAAPPPFLDYVNAQFHVSVHAPTRDMLFGETRRDKLYNSLFWVGPHLERFMAVGLLACLDCFLARPLRWLAPLHCLAQSSLKHL